METQNVEIFENERAQKYDNVIPQLIPNYGFMIESIPLALEAEAKAGQRDLLVAGCGTGNEIQAFLESGYEWNITGVDPSPEMVEIAKRKLKDAQNVKLFTSTVADMSPEQTFDAATLLLVMHFLPDDGAKLALLQSINQRLKPGAALVLMDIYGDSDEMDQQLRILKNFFPPSIPADEVPMRLSRIKDYIQHIDEPRLGELMRQSGFEKPVRFSQFSVYGCWITKKV